MLQRPLTLILLQKHRDANGRRIVIQIGGVYTTFCQREGILLQKYRDRNGRFIAILFKNIGVRGRFDSPERGWSTNGTDENRTGEPRPLDWTLSWALPWTPSWDVSRELSWDVSWELPGESLKA